MLCTKYLRFFEVAANTALSLTLVKNILIARTLDSVTRNRSRPFIYLLPFSSIYVENKLSKICMKKGPVSAIRRNRAEGQSPKDPRAILSDSGLSANLLTETGLVVVPRAAEVVPAHVRLNKVAVEIRHEEVAIVVPDDISPSIEEFAFVPRLEGCRQIGPVLLHVGQFGQAEVTMNGVTGRDIVRILLFVVADFVARDERSENLVTAGAILLVFVSGLTRMEVRRSHDGREVDFLRTTDVAFENPPFRPVRKLRVGRQSGDGHGRIGAALVGSDEFAGEAIQTLGVPEKSLEMIFIETARFEPGGNERDELIFLVLCCHCVAKGY